MFLLLDLHWDSPKLPWGIQRTCGPFVLKTIIMPFKRIFVLWHSLIRSLYFIQVYIFIPLIHSALLLRFSHILLHQFFLMYITTRNIILIPDDAVARNLIVTFNFSSWRPHLNYIFLSNVYSFDTMEFSMKHKLQAMLLLFNKSGSLECAKVVVLKLGAVLFYSGIHFKPLKLWKKICCEDLNRHISQKINEFASLALAGRYP